MMAILLTVSLFIFGMLRIVMPTLYQQQLDAQFISNVNTLTAQLETLPVDEWSMVITLFADENNAAISISKFDETGNLTPLITSLPSGDEGEDLRNRFLLGETSDFNIGFTHQQHEYAIATTSESIITSINQMEGIFTQVFPYVLTIVLLIATFSAFFYTRFLARPIIDIAYASKKIANLDMTWHCNTTRSDEIGLLANNLNHMASQLSSTLQELQNANKKLQDDIEKEREHERRRRDFFTAVSHELKTPVTILKGELDGMILNIGKFKDRDKYLQEAYKTNESIERLVREIMILAKLDTIHLKLEKINLSDMIAEVSNIYEPIAQHKNLTIKSNSEVDVVVQADRTQLQTVISNVISNAINHSPEQQEIGIYLTKENENVVLTIENKGIQIDEGELSKLWEPFYRTDKSRSRNTGGSGLGLYIVKTILDLHGFSHKLENCEDGVKFRVKFGVEFGVEF